MTFILWIRVTLVIKVFRLIVCDSEKFGRSWVRRFEVHIQRIRTYCRCIWLNLFTVSIAWGTLGVKNLKLKIDKNTLQHSYSISHNFLLQVRNKTGVKSLIYDHERLQNDQYENSCVAMVPWSGQAKSSLKCTIGVKKICEDWKIPIIKRISKEIILSKTI